DANTINRVGDLYGRVGQIDKAVELYERIADHFNQDGFTTKAIAILKKINRLAPQRLDVFERLAEMYIQQGLMVEAKSQYQVLADWYVKNGEQEKAVDTHEKLVRLDPNNHMAHLRLADLLMQGGQAQKAVEVYERLGRVLLERDKLEEAERLYRHALDQDPPDGEFLAPLCEALLDSGKTAPAREFLHAAMLRSPKSRVLQLIEVRTLLAFGESDKALAKANGILAEAPDDQGVRSLVARALLSCGDVENAREMTLPACEQLLDRGEFGAAQKLLKDLLEVIPQDQQTLNLAVRAYRPSGDQATLAGLIEALADSCYQSDQREQAQRLYMELLERQPGNDVFRHRLAQLQGVDPDQVVIEPTEIDASGSEFGTARTEAAGEPVAAQAVGPEAPSVAIDPAERLAEAKVFAKYGLLEKATTHLEEIIKFYPDQTEARAILVSLYVEQGEKESALVVAQPLCDHYREVADEEALATLLTSLPELATEPEEVVELAAQVEDDVIVLDLDEAIAESEIEEVIPIEVEEVQEAVEALEAPISEAEPAEVVDLIQSDDVSVEPEDLEDEFVIDLDAEQPVVVDVDLEEPAAAAVAGSPDEVELHEHDGESEEMVEISSTIVGPSVAELDQLDFFIEQDLHEDAIRLLGKLESEFHDDPEVSERRLALKAKGVLLEEVVATPDEPEELFADEEESYVDLAKELEMEMAEEEAMVDEATGRGKEEALLEEVFREFQKGVEEQLSDADTDTHFNLGIAYKEMGLLPEAIREFQVSSRDPNLFIECCSMIGVCYMEQGMWDQAADWYQKALDTPNLGQDAQMALQYDLASALQSAGEPQRAAGLYEEIAAINPTYRDVSGRLNSLGEYRQVN
ncbi:MAG: tetratricopeptide repeat protein, partial [Deltaproteobacteria bacterium]|nr:tetratricopeptide repeat protein [Deltaproteobacteria bacterium]